MRVTKNTFWNVVEAHSSRQVADYGFRCVEIAEMTGVEPLREAGGPRSYWISQIEDVLNDAVQRYRDRNSAAKRSLVA